MNKMPINFNRLYYYWFNTSSNDPNTRTESKFIIGLADFRLLEFGKLDILKVGY